MCSSPSCLDPSTHPGDGLIASSIPSPVAQPNRRPTIDSLTSIRGLAALWVVFYHFQADLYTLFPITATAQPFLNQGHFAVPIFFVLSGYVLTHNYLESMGTRISRSELCKFWGRRLLRIYPLHVATLFAVLVMVIVARILGLSITEEGYSRRDFVLNLLLMHTWVPDFRLNWNYPSWSISSEWFAYLFFPLVCLVLVRARRLTTLVGLMILSFALSIGFLLAGDRLPFREMTAVVGPFLLGCTFARAVALRHSPGPGLLRVGAWTSLMALVIAPYLTTGQALPIAMLMSGAVLVFALGASGGECSRFWSWPPLILLGEVSYSLYLTHTLVQKLFHETVPTAMFVGRSLMARFLFLAGYAMAIALVSLLAYIWIEVLFRKTLRRRFSL